MSTELPFALTHQVRDNCLCLHVQRAARALARRFDEALRPVGLTQGQFSLLMSLNRPNAADHRRRFDFAGARSHDAHCEFEATERRGLVKVKVDAEDRRSRRLLLTAAGRAVLVAAAPIWKRAHAQTERLLRSTNADSVRKSLHELC